MPKQPATPPNIPDYDFVNARPPRKTTNFIESVAHLAKSILGGGVVAIHETYKQCGLWTALALNVVLGFGTGCCMLMLVHSAHKVYVRTRTPLLSYPDFVEKAFEIGPWESARKYRKVFKHIVGAAISINLFGACCVYQVVISRTLKQLVEQKNKIDDGGNPPIRVYLICLLVPCILICLITSLKYLAPFSLVGNVFLLVVVGATLYYALQYKSIPLEEMPAFKNIPGLLEFIGVCVFSMDGFGAVFPIENNMTNPYQMPQVIFCGMAMVMSVVMTMGFFGYWGFGEDSYSPITVNFPLTAFPLVLKGFMAVLMYVTFALNFWIPFNVVWALIAKRYPAERHWLWERVYRTLFVCGINVMAIAFPNVSKFMGVLGSFCISNTGFIYPPIIELSLDWDYPGLGLMKWRLIKCIVVVIFGVCLCIIGTVSNVKELITEVYAKQ